MKLQEMREKRAKCIHDARALTEKAEAEKRAVTTEERTAFDAFINESDTLRADIERIEKLENAERELESSKRQTEPNNTRSNGTTNTNAVNELRYKLPFAAQERVIPINSARNTDLHKRAWNKYLAGGNRALNGEESRALQADNDTEGGYLQSPQEFIARLIQNVDNMVFMRQAATVLPAVTTNNGVGVPTLDTDMDDADWTSELLTGNEDTALRFGKRELKPQPLAKRVKCSNKLIRSAALSIESIIRERLAYKFGVSMEKGYLTGTGFNQPLGVFTASADGISTGRDVSTDNTTTAITFDGLKNAKYTLKGQYWGRASWMFHRDALKQLSKIKDGEGRYIWEQSVIAGTPDRLLNMPIIMSEYVPNTFTTGLYVGILGDFSNYWIVDALTLTVQTLTELYAETNQTGYIGRLETDGMPVLEEAFVRVTLA